MNKFDKYLKNYPILFFFIFFIFSFFILLTISNLWLNDKMNNFNYYLFRSYFIEKINKNLTLKRQINTTLSDNYINFSILYYDKKNNDNTYPEKFEVLVLISDNTLNKVLFPEFGCPTNATVLFKHLFS